MSVTRVVEVDLVLPVRFPAPWLQECLTSITAISDVRFTLLLAMHGASELPSEVTLDIEHFRLVECSPSSSLSAVLNAGVAAGNAPYVARIDADDVMTRHRLRRQIDFLDSNPATVVLGSSAAEIDSSGRDLGYRQGSGNPSQTKLRLLWRNPIIHPTVMFRRSAFEQVGGYSEEARLTEDYDLWLRMAVLGEIQSIDEPLIAYRLHAAQTSRRGQISRASQSQVLNSRISLARALGRSEFGARLKHLAWRFRHRAF